MADLKAFAKVIATCVALVFCATTASAQRVVKQSIRWSDDQIREYLASNPQDTCVYDLRKLGEKDGKYHVIERKRIALFDGEPRLFRDTIMVPVKRLRDMTPEEFRAVREGRMEALNENDRISCRGCISR